MSDAVKIAIIVLLGQIVSAISIAIDNRRVLRLYELQQMVNAKRILTDNLSSVQQQIKNAPDEL